MKLIDLTGKQIDKWTVLYRVQSSRNNRVLWKCRCVCGIEKTVYACHLQSGMSKSCGCNSNLCQDKHKDWKGYGDISGSYWSYLKSCANGRSKRKPIEFSITIEYVWDLFLEQNKLCAISKIPIIINFDKKHYVNRSGLEHTASLDRKDNTLGYIIGNVQWLHKDVNMMKRVYDQDYFINLCKIIANANKG